MIPNERPEVMMQHAIFHQDDSSVLTPALPSFFAGRPTRRWLIALLIVCALPASVPGFSNYCCKEFYCNSIVCWKVHCVASALKPE